MPDPNSMEALGDVTPNIDLCHALLSRDISLFNLVTVSTVDAQAFSGIKVRYIEILTNFQINMLSFSHFTAISSICHSVLTVKS